LAILSQFLMNQSIRRKIAIPSRQFPLVRSDVARTSPRRERRPRGENLIETRTRIRDRQSNTEKKQMTRNTFMQTFGANSLVRTLTLALAGLMLTGCGFTPPQPSPQPQPQPTPDPTPAPDAGTNGQQDAGTNGQPDAGTNALPDPQPAAQPRLFIANFAGFSVTSYADPATVNGNIAPDTNLQGAQTQLFQPIGLTVDNSGALSVANRAGASVTSYDDADTTNGNLAPDRNVQGAATQFVSPRDLEHQSETDLMYVLDDATRLIHVFDAASTSTFNGNLAPMRTINASATMAAPTGLSMGEGDELYVSDGAGFVYVFANASTLNGVVAPTRIITSASFGAPMDVFIDQSDNMLVADVAGNFIYTFNNAASLNGTVAPDFSLQVQGAAAIYSVVTDSNDTGFIADAGNAIFSYDGISTLNGTLAADRTIQGANTLLSTPIRVFLTE